MFLVKDEFLICSDGFIQKNDDFFPEPGLLIDVKQVLFEISTWKILVMGWQSAFFLLKARKNSTRKNLWHNKKTWIR